MFSLRAAASLILFTNKSFIFPGHFYLRRRSKTRSNGQTHGTRTVILIPAIFASVALFRGTERRTTDSRGYRRKSSKYLREKVLPQRSATPRREKVDIMTVESGVAILHSLDQKAKDPRGSALPLQKDLNYRRGIPPL